MSHPDSFRYTGQQYFLPKVVKADLPDIGPAELKSRFFNIPENTPMRRSKELKACLTTAFVQLLARDNIPEPQRQLMLNQFKNSSEWYQLNTMPTNVKNSSSSARGQNQPHMDTKAPRRAPSGPRAFDKPRLADRVSSRELADDFLSRMGPSVGRRDVGHLSYDRYRPSERERDTRAREHRLTPDRQLPPLRTYDRESGGLYTKPWDLPSGTNGKPLGVVTLPWFYDVVAEMNQQIKAMKLPPWDDLLHAYKQFVQTHYGVDKSRSHISSEISGSLKDRIPSEVRQHHLKLLLTERGRMGPSVSAPSTPATTVQKRPFEAHSGPREEQAKRVRVEERPRTPQENNSNGMAAPSRGLIYSPSMPNLHTAVPQFMGTVSPSVAQTKTALPGITPQTTHVDPSSNGGDETLDLSQILKDADELNKGRDVKPPLGFLRPKENGAGEMHVKGAAGQKSLLKNINGHSNKTIDSEATTAMKTDPPQHRELVDLTSISSRTRADSIAPSSANGGRNSPHTTRGGIASSSAPPEPAVAGSYNAMALPSFIRGISREYKSMEEGMNSAGLPHGSMEWRVAMYKLGGLIQTAMEEIGAPKYNFGT